MLDEEARRRHPNDGVPSTEARIETTASTVKYGPFMVGHIEAPGFDVVARRPERQPVVGDKDVEWLWGVTPRKPQTMTVAVRLDALVDGASDVIRVFEGEVVVRGTVRQRVAGFVGENWYWFWPAIAASIVASWYASRLGKLKVRSSGNTSQASRLSLKIFLSYASEQAGVAEAIYLGLLGLGHRVFYDRESLLPGGNYLTEISRQIDESDAFIFLISPQAVETGRYTLSELELARKKWPHPHGHVLPVLCADTPLDCVPVYLKAVTLFQPAGNIVAGVAQAVDAVFLAPELIPTGS